MPHIKIKAGETHEFSVDSNPTTGYSWFHEVENPEIVEVDGRM